MGVSDLGNQTGAVVKDGEIVNIYLDKYAKPIISCADALTGIRFLGNLSEMIAGKIVAAVSGELTKTYEIADPAPANILDQLNVEFRDFFAIATDADGWIVDTLNATVADDTRVSITPVQNNDWSLATWKSDIYVDRRDVEHGLNTTLLQDGGSLNFCLAKPAVDPGISCEGALTYTSEISMDGSLGLAWGSDGFVEYTTPEELIAALEAKGLEVDIITDPEPPIE